MAQMALQSIISLKKGGSLSVQNISDLDLEFLQTERCLQVLLL